MNYQRVRPVLQPTNARAVLISPCPVSTHPKTGTGRTHKKDLCYCLAAVTWQHHPLQIDLVTTFANKRRIHQSSYLIFSTHKFGHRFPSHCLVKQFEKQRLAKRLNETAQTNHAIHSSPPFVSGGPHCSPRSATTRGQLLRGKNFEKALFTGIGCFGHRVRGLRHLYHLYHLHQQPRKQIAPQSFSGKSCHQQHLHQRYKFPSSRS